MKLDRYHPPFMLGDAEQRLLDKAHEFYQRQVDNADLKPSEKELKVRFKAASEKILADVKRRSGR